MKHLIIFTLIAGLILIGLASYQYVTLSDNKLHVIFCTVGQGDGILIRTPSGKTILFDGGPNDKILDCLSRHLPFWQRTIDLMLLSHPHADHLNGLIHVLKGYSLLSFGSEDLANKTVEYRQLHAMLKERGVEQRKLISGDVYTLSDGVKLTVVGPTESFLKLTSPGGTIGERKEFASVELLITYGKNSFLLTGDSQATQLDQSTTQHDLSRLDVLHVPHHGSHTGLTTAILQKLKPSYAVISVGKNSYGHPTSFILNLLKEQSVPILRTDRGGDVEFVSDGRTVVIKR